MTGSGSIGPVARHAADWLRQQLPAQGRLRSDSRRVVAGDAFFAYPGEQGDGRDWLRPALDAGAAAIVVERAGLEAFAEVVANARVPSLVVEGLRRQAGEIASAYLGEPSARVNDAFAAMTRPVVSAMHMGTLDSRKVRSC